MGIKKFCKWCNTEYESKLKSSKYCSKNCCKRYNKSLKNPNLPIFAPTEYKHNCLHCGAEFTSKSSLSKFCSSRCKYRYGVFIKTNVKILDEFNPTRKCLYCGNTFTNNSINAKYCSKKCKKKSHLKNKKMGIAKPVAVLYKHNCLHCGTEFTSKSKHSKYCKETCKTKHCLHLKRLKSIKYCQYCSKVIVPNFTGSGGRRYKFCSDKCSELFHHKKRSPKNEIVIRIDKNTVIYTKNFDKVDEIRKKHLDAIKKQKTNIGFASELYNPYLFKINFNE